MAATAELNNSPLSEAYTMSFIQLNIAAFDERVYLPFLKRELIKPTSHQAAQLEIFC